MMHKAVQRGPVAAPRVQPWEQWRGEHERRQRARVGFPLAIGGALALPTLFAAWAFGAHHEGVPFFAVTVLGALACTTTGLVLQRRALDHPSAADTAAAAGSPRWAVGACLLLGGVEATVAIAVRGDVGTLAALLLPTTGVVGRALLLRLATADAAPFPERWRNGTTPSVPPDAGELGRPGEPGRPGSHGGRA